jgi:hypothetical protein
MFDPEGQTANLNCRIDYYRSAGTINLVLQMYVCIDISV